MNTVHRFALAPRESRSDRPSHRVRAQALCRMKNRLFHVLIRRADHATNLPGDAHPRRQGTPSPGHAPPGGKQFP
jgi:hypothetical protein